MRTALVLSLKKGGMILKAHVDIISWKIVKVNIPTLCKPSLLFVV